MPNFLVIPFFWVAVSSAPLLWYCPWLRGNHYHPNLVKQRLTCVKLLLITCVLCGIKSPIRGKVNFIHCSASVASVPIFFLPLLLWLTCLIPALKSRTHFSNLKCEQLCASRHALQHTLLPAITKLWTTTGRLFPHVYIVWECFHISSRTYWSCPGSFLLLRASSATSRSSIDSCLRHSFLQHSLAIISAELRLKERHRLLALVAELPFWGVDEATGWNSTWPPVSSMSKKNEWSVWSWLAESSSTIEWSVSSSKNNSEWSVASITSLEHKRNVKIIIVKLSLSMSKRVQCITMPAHNMVVVVKTQLSWHYLSIMKMKRMLNVVISPDFEELAYQSHRARL